MAGYLPTSAPGTPNFYIDRTDVGGVITGLPVVFQREYFISADANCTTPLPSADCFGISIIETQVPNTAPLGALPNAGAYALAGACTAGCFFTILSPIGIPVTRVLYPINLTPGGTMSKPIILEASTSLSGNKEYFICGSYSDPTFGITGMMYALRVDRFGSIIWSATYASFYAIPNDMIENPYTPGLRVVGKYDDSISPSSGFLLDLDPATGGYTPLVFTNVGVTYYSIGSNPGWFSSIAIANSPSPGFVIGGSSQPVNNTGNAWILKTKMAGTAIQWSTLVTPNSDINAGDLVDVIERKNTSNNYEYYGVTSSQAGIITLKLNASGIPSGNNDEFLYDAGNSRSIVSNIDFSDNTGTDEGLHIFGTDDGTLPASHYFTESYFSGHTGCTNPVSTLTYEQPGPGAVFSAWFVVAGPSACTRLNITSAQTGGFNPLCGPFASVGSGSNAREATTGINENIPTKQDVNIYPNPTSGSALLKYNLHDAATVTITLYNHLGQLVKTLYNTAEVAGAHEWIIDFNELNVESGLYFVTSAINGQSSTQKVVYTK